MRSLGRRRARIPWTRISIVLAIGAPALAIGGVPSWVVPMELGLVMLVWGRLWMSRDDLAALRVPAFAGLGLLLLLATFGQWLPVPGVRGLLAPAVQAEVEAALAGTGIEPPGGLTVSRADTALEVTRLGALLALFVAAAAFAWWWISAVVAGVGSAVAVLGLVHGITRADAIYGVYVPQHVDRAAIPALMGPFVNPNHQSGMLLLGVFAALGVAVEFRRQAADPRALDPLRKREHAALAVFACFLQAAALLLSLSRGAIVAAAVFGPIALVLVAGTRARARVPRRKAVSLVRAFAYFALGGVLLVVARHGAWQELRTLTDLETAYAKFAATRDAWPLLADAWILGSGRGTFIDRFGMVASAPSRVVMTHLECAPVTALVEWGVFVGGLAIVGAIVGWVRALGVGGPERVGRVVVLLGVGALGLQSLGDMSLEFLGVTAPLAALAGALSGDAKRRLATRRAAPVVFGGLAGLLVWSLSIHDRTWSHRDRHDAWDELSARPLDGRLHLHLGRRAATEGDWDTAAARADVAVHLRPGAIDGWLLQAAAAKRRGDDAARDRATERALALLTTALDPELTAFLVDLYPDPRGFAVRSVGARWPLLFAALKERFPAHADAVARVHAELAPRDASPWIARAGLARSRGHMVLALHFATLARACDPGAGDAYVEIALALVGQAPPRLDEAIATLEAALQEPLRGDASRAGVEELLVRLLMRRGAPSDRSLAQRIAGSLRQREGTLAQRRVRERLYAELTELTEQVEEP